MQQLAVSYVANGYYFYVTGTIPEGKDPTRVDAKLIMRYGIDISKWTRARRRREGEAGVQYLRFNRFFVLLATHGEHRFFEEERVSMRDVRRVPINVFCYSLSIRGERVHVRIRGDEFKLMKREYLERRAFQRTEDLVAAFRSLPYEPYAPVRRQLLLLWRAVNRRRRVAGLDQIGIEVIRLRRHILLPFREALHRAR